MDLTTHGLPRVADAAGVDRGVAVVIPTKDRPQFLDESIESALRQTYAPAEVIVVDDGSSTPVRQEALRSRHGPTVRLLRNERSLGLAYARNWGVEEAKAAYVIHLDDDDRLVPVAIERCLDVYCAHPDVDLVMFGVEGFGASAEHFNRVQPEGVRRVIAAAGGQLVGGGRVLFDRALFPALLSRVPSAFQRVMTTRAFWRRVSEARWKAYDDRDRGSTSPSPHPKLRLPGPLRDSEWAWYAALLGRRTCLLTQPLYLARFDGQGYSSVPANADAHMRQRVAMLRQLNDAIARIDELRAFRRNIRETLAAAHFGAAYTLEQNGELKVAWQSLASAMATRLRPRQFKLLAKLALASVRRR
jgi:glycosyltransferase involved in cell wall biosynthesis